MAKKRIEIVGDGSSEKETRRIKIRETHNIGTSAKTDSSEKLSILFNPKKKGKKTIFQHFAVRISQFIVLIPLAALLNIVFPSINLAGIQFDIVICVIICFAITELLVRYMRGVIYSAMVIIFSVFIINAFSENYTFGDVFRNYKEFVFGLNHRTIEMPYQIAEDKSNKEWKDILVNVEYSHPDVKDYANINSTKYFNSYYSKYHFWSRYFSLFKEIRSHWQYNKDPITGYYSPASRTINTLSGDCDDYTIFMSACLMSIGAQMRMVITEEHIYPEIMIGTTKDINKLNMAIRDMFPDESEDKDIFYHTDDNGDIWLNLDYFDTYPGGKYSNSVIKSVIYIN